MPLVTTVAIYTMYTRSFEFSFLYTTFPHPLSSHLIPSLCVSLPLIYLFQPLFPYRSHHCVSAIYLSLSVVPPLKWSVWTYVKVCTLLLLLLLLRTAVKGKGGSQENIVVYKTRNVSRAANKGLIRCVLTWDERDGVQGKIRVYNANALPLCVCVCVFV